MKTKTLLLGYLLFCSIPIYSQPLLVGEVVIDVPYSYLEYGIDDIMLLDNQLLMSRSNSSPSFYYDGNAWEILYYHDVGYLSGIIKNNGDIVSYSQSNENFIKWNNSSHVWDVLPRPLSMKLISQLYVVNEQEIWMEERHATGYFHLHRYDGVSFTCEYQDTIGNSIQHLLVYEGNVFFVRWSTNTTLSCYNSITDLVSDVVTLSGVSYISDIQSLDGDNFYFLTDVGNVYHYNITTTTLDTLLLRPANDTSSYSTTLALVASSLMFVAGYDGIKRIVVNNGVVSTDVVYVVNHPGGNFDYTSIACSSVYGDHAVFAGNLYHANYPSQPHLNEFFYVSLQFPVPVSISATEQQNTLFPNPTNGALYIDKMPDDTIIQIFDMMGRCVMTTSLIDNVINVSHLSPGIYIIKNIGKFIKN